MRGFLWTVLSLSMLLVCGAIIIPLWDGAPASFLSSAIGVVNPTGPETPISESLLKAGIRYCHKEIYEKAKAVENSSPLYLLLGSSSDLQQSVLIAATAPNSQFLVLDTFGDRSPCQMSVAKYAVLDKACKDFTDDELKDAEVSRKLDYGFYFGTRTDSATILLKDLGTKCLAILSNAR